MKKFRILLLTLATLLVGNVHADEGMWLLQLMQEQNSIDLMKARGLELNATDLYNPSGVSIKDAVGIFGRGCTGEIISDKGLILTNHHCGFGAIQQHSSVDHDYLTDGFWAKNHNEELATPGLTFQFVDQIIDVTALVQKDIDKKKVTELESFGYDYLQKLAQTQMKKMHLNKKKGYRGVCKPFYAGNKFYLMIMKVYSDIRMVAAPPASVGKFGGETDNWMWPRHTGDFSMFRIYADKDGNPADYSEKNVPLQTKKHFAINIKGVEDGDYAMIMGFPGSTERYLTDAEITMTMRTENDPRIAVRTEYLKTIKKEMKANKKIRIQYDTKYAHSANYWKNSIGMNEALVNNKVRETKRDIQAKFLDFAKQKKDAAYETVVADIATTVDALSPLNYQINAMNESFFRTIEFRLLKKDRDLFTDFANALEKDKKHALKKYSKDLQAVFTRIHNKDYDQKVDKEVTNAMINVYASLVKPAERPAFYTEIKNDYQGNVQKYVDNIYSKSILRSQKALDSFLADAHADALRNDPVLLFSKSIVDRFNVVEKDYKPLMDKLALLHKTYIRGLGEMKQPTPSYPDANFTLRLTYGTVASYDPKDGVHYKYYTTGQGILEKEDDKSDEFKVPAKLHKLLVNKDFGRYAMKNGELPVCFLTTNDITGGNSGSPVINSKGQLIGCAFDGNWESLSGDLNFNDNLQRCIVLDIRYMLFILDKLGGCKHLVDEMTIIQ